MEEKMFDWLMQNGTLEMWQFIGIGSVIFGAGMAVGSIICAEIELRRRERQGVRFWIGPGMID